MITMLHSTWHSIIKCLFLLMSRRATWSRSNHLGARAETCRTWVHRLCLIPCGWSARGRSRPTWTAWGLGCGVQISRYVDVTTVLTIRFFKPFLVVICCNYLEPDLIRGRWRLFGRFVPGWSHQKNQLTPSFVGFAEVIWHNQFCYSSSCQSNMGDSSHAVFPFPRPSGYKMIATRVTLR